MELARYEHNILFILLHHLIIFCAQIASIGNFGLIDNDTPQSAYTKVIFGDSHDNMEVAHMSDRRVGKITQKWNLFSRTNSTRKAVPSTRVMIPTGKRRICTTGAQMTWNGKSFRLMGPNVNSLCVVQVRPSGYNHCQRRE